MKQLLFAILLFSFTITAAQKKSKVYGDVTAVAFAEPDADAKFGASINVGYAITNNFGFGVIADVFPDKDGNGYGQVAADFKYLIAGINKQVSPFIALQPGTVIYSKDQKIGNTTITTRGSFAFNAMAGVRWMPSDAIGLSFSVGYSTIGFTVKDDERRTSGLRIQLGLSF